MNVMNELNYSDRLLIKKSVEGGLRRYPGALSEEYLERIFQVLSLPEDSNEGLFLKDLAQKSTKSRSISAICGKELADRLITELSTIISMGFSDYFLIVQDFLNVGRKIGRMPDSRFQYLKEHYQEMTVPEMLAYIEKDQSYPGMTIGPGRGSAAGSLATYFMGITNIDPITHGLLFERFLNPERVSMPDIDSDLSKSDFDYGVRDIVISYCTKKYGENAICGIATPSTLAARAAVKEIGRIVGSRYASRNKNAEYEPTKKMYLRYVDEINREIPASPNITFHSEMENGKTLIENLHEKFADQPQLMEIIDLAVKAEGLNINFGMHACGKIIYPGDIRDAAPMMVDPDSGIWKIQMDAEEAESRGYLKMDVRFVR